MSEIVIEGTNLGYTTKPYDFVDQQTGERRTGTTQKLHVLTGMESVEVRVEDAYVAMARALPVNRPVTLVVEVPKQTRFKFVSVIEQAQVKAS